MIRGDREFKLRQAKLSIEKIKSKLYTRKKPKYNKYIRIFGRDVVKALDDLLELVEDLSEESC